MKSRAATEYRYEKLTYPEINDAVDLRKVCILPCGAIEQHGPHLPLDVDVVLPTSVAYGVGQLMPDKVLVLPCASYGYTGHVMDFPGTINNDWRHFAESVLDITRSLAYHGFKKIMLLNGHGSNMPVLDFVTRRTYLETDAECIALGWWGMLTVDKDFLPSWRESKFPGGCAHACEMETAMYMYLDPDNVRTDKIEPGEIAMNKDGNPFLWLDAFTSGPGMFVPWTSAYTTNGVMGEPQLATAEKGERCYKEAVKQLARFVDYFRDRPKDQRHDHHRHTPTMPMPWKQTPVAP